MRLIFLATLLSFTLGCSEENRPPVGADLPSPSLARLSEIRDEVGIASDWGSQSAQIGMGIFTDDWDTVQQLLSMDKHAVMCQGAAYSLHMRYKDLGYRSYLVGFKTPIMSHAVSLVEFENRLIIMDPTFNSTFVNPEDGKPLSVFEVMEAAHFPARVPMVVDTGAPVSVNFIQMKADPLGSHPYRSERILKSTADYDVYSATISIQRFEASISKQLKEYASAEDLPPTATTAVYTGEPIYVYNTYPMSTKEKAEADELHQKLIAHYKKLKMARSEQSNALDEG